MKLITKTIIALAIVATTTSLAVADNSDLAWKYVKELSTRLATPDRTDYSEEFYYRNFLIEAALGKMKQGISYANFRLKAQRALEDGDYKYSSDCYRFGIAVNTFTIGNQYKNSAGEKSVKGKEIVIKESQDKVATDAYLIWPGSVKGTYLSELVGTISKDHDLILDEKNVSYILQGETSDNKTLLLISYTPENGEAVKVSYQRQVLDIC